jgi:hypothetical protein
MIIEELKELTIIREQNKASYYFGHQSAYASTDLQVIDIVIFRAQQNEQKANFDLNLDKVVFQNQDKNKIRFNRSIIINLNCIINSIQFLPII